MTARALGAVGQGCPPQGPGPWGVPPPHSPIGVSQGRVWALGLQGSGSCGQHGLARLSGSWPALQLLDIHKGTAPK